MKFVLLVISVFIVSACTTPFQTGLGERDLYVVNTPDYPDNRVFYLGTTTDRSTDLVPSDAIPDGTTDPKHGEPLTVIVNSVGLPYIEGGGSARRDLALILDIQAENQGNTQSIVVWYQRGVLHGQTLNFSNLLIYNQEAWDDRVAPHFRIRLMDVASERNLETREALAEVSKFGGVVALALQNPALNPVIATAARAASLVLASRDNRLVLDYTVQFYGKRSVENLPGTFLTPLKVGRFALVGRKPADLANSQFWRTPMTYDEVNGTIDAKSQTGKTQLQTPAIVVTVTNQEAIVPAFVASKSAYLTRLLTEANTKNLEEILRESADLSQRVKAFVVREKVYRYRQKGDLNDLVDLMTNADDPLPADINGSLIRFMRKISGCNALSLNTVGNWWQVVEPKADFKPDEFKLNIDPNSDCS